MRMRQRLLLAALLVVSAETPALAETVARDNIDALIEQQAKANKVPAAFVHRVVKRESNYNPRAKGGSALGLMQIKHATARGMGYKGEAAGLFDPETNLKYGIAYLAGAYRAAQGDLDRAYMYYNRGYYYVAKRLGISNEVADDATSPTPAAQSATGFASLFGPRPAAPVMTASADPNAAIAGTPAMAYAGAASGDVIAVVEVPLPPRRPAALGAAEAPQLAAAQPAPAAPKPELRLSTEQMTAQTTAVKASAASVASADAVEVPLPPRRPAATLLAAVTRQTPARKPAVDSAPVLEASAAVAAQ